MTGRSWPTARLGDLADLALGKMLDKKKATGLHPRPYLRNINVRWHRLDLTDLAQMDIRPQESERFSVRTDDVLVCEGGEPGRCALVPAEADGLAYQKALHRVRVGPDLDARFLCFSLLSLARTKQLDLYFTGTTIKHLPGEKLAEVRIALPAIEEQIEIARQLTQCQGQIEMMSEAMRSLQTRLDSTWSAILSTTLRPQDGAVL